MNGQLTLGVGLRDQATFESYWPGQQNRQLVDALKHALAGRGERLIYFYGASGLGKTHLLHACCHAAGQQSVYLPLSDWQHLSPDVFPGLENLPVVCLDDIHCIAGQAAWEEAFFHVFNRIRAREGILAVSAAGLPAVLGYGLPDLVSRLSGGIIFQLQPLPDDEKRDMLVMRAAIRGMVLPEEVARFILTHCPRHHSTLCAALDVLDRASLAAQRRLTVPFVKSVLEI